MSRPTHVIIENLDADRDGVADDCDITGGTITGVTIDSVVIGGTTPAAADVTDLTATGDVVLGDVSDAELHILDGATVTTAEVNLLDISAQTETTIAAGTASAIIRITKLDSNAGAGSFTLAAPDASMIGQVKIIEMTVAGNALTLALTNVQGGSAASSASFDATGETLILVGGTTKWTVIGEVGVTLS